MRNTLFGGIFKTRIATKTGLRNYWQYSVVAVVNNKPEFDFYDERLPIENGILFEVISDESVKYYSSVENAEKALEELLNG